MNNFLILVRGLPGSGKTTIAKLLAKKNNALHYEADMFMINASGEYDFDPRLLSDAHKWCQRKTFEGLASGRNVVVSNTFTTRKEIGPYFKMIDEKPEVIACKGNFKSVHNVPENVMDKMRRRWEHISKESYYYPLVHVLVDA